MPIVFGKTEMNGKVYIFSVDYDTIILVVLRTFINI